jgi:allophanate hydrolase subunit 2
LIAFERVFGIVAERSPNCGLRRFGVPIGGPWDQVAAQLSNAAIGLPVDDPTWEILNGTAKVYFAESGSLAVFGADIQITHRDECLAGSRRIHLETGESIEIRARVGYVAVGSEFRRPVRYVDPIPSETTVLRCLPTEDVGIKSPLVVLPKSNRMGIRLSGGPPSLLELPSEPVCPGTIQQTPNGEIIVIGPDGPTIGGYPKVGVVIEADLRKLPYLSPGQSVTFRAIEVEEAITALTEQRAQSVRNVRLVQLSDG